MKNHNYKSKITISVIATVLSLLLFSMIGCTESEEENTFIRLMKLIPAEAKDSGGFILIDYEKIWQANGISTINSDGSVLSQGEWNAPRLNWRDE